MIDWHSHILPGMDDGSRDIAESIALLKMLHSQGADMVVATPHFYADNESVERFLERRKNSFEELNQKLTDGSPKILLGAEVRYYQGISHLSQLSELSIENNRLLLLEMPMVKWTEYTVRELIELSGHSNITLMLAHIDRYLHLQKTDVWARLCESEILMQVNAGFFVDFLTRRKAMALLNDGAPLFIGSDCHNTVSRPPRIGKAFEIIGKKSGRDFINQINEYGYSVLMKNNY